MYPPKATTSPEHCSSPAHKHKAISPYYSVLINLHWLPVQYRIQLKILSLVYKALHDLSPSYLKDLLAYNSSQRKLRSTSHELLRIPRSRLKSYGDAFASQDQSYGTSYHWILGKALRWLFLRNLLKHIFLKCFLIVFNVYYFYIVRFLL